MKTGAKHSFEAREKMRLSHLKNPQRYWLGKKRHQETIEIMRNAATGRRFSQESLEKIRKKSKQMWASLTEQQKQEWAKKVSESMTGKRNHRWKDGRTPVNEKIRKSLEYRLWREAVFKKNDWTCVFCREKGGKLHADHIRPFALFPELRFAIDNGRTLCVKCHKKTNSYGWKFNTSFQLDLL